MASPISTLEHAAAWLQDGRRVALATVIEAWGSSPCPPGSLLAICGDGRFEGSVSGGCIEGAVVAEALGVLDGGKPRVIAYGVPDSKAWEVGLACGGRLDVLIAAAPDAATLRALIGHPPAALVTDLESGRQGWVGPERAEGMLTLSGAAVAEARAALAEDRSRCLDVPDARLFATVFGSQARLVIVGAVHIAQELAPMAAAAGYGVTIVDPRMAFASVERFGGLAVNHGWPDEALAALAPDARTAVVTLSHDPKLDDPALEAALRSPAFYIGALGSRRTHAKRLDRLRALGVAESALARIHGPIGLDLGGRRPAEIAVATLAQIIAARYGRITTRAV